MSKYVLGIYKYFMRVKNNNKKLFLDSFSTWSERFEHQDDFLVKKKKINKKVSVTKFPF